MKNILIVLKNIFGKTRVCNFLIVRIKLVACSLIFSTSVTAQTSGGPDLFGYTWFDSNDPAGPAFSWIDIDSLPGTVDVTGLSDDNIMGPYSMQIPFEYYGNQPAQFWIGSNGYLGFTNVQLAHPFPTIPTATYIQNYIAVMATDLTFTDSSGQQVPGAECKYWFSPGNDTLIVTWKDVPFWHSVTGGYTGLNSFQVILSAFDHSITFQYLLQSGVYSNPTNFLTTGIESNMGLTGLQVLYDIYPVSGTSVLFTTREYNKMKGKVFVDLNSNAVQDSNENPVVNHKIVEQNTGRIAFTEVNGNYLLAVLDSGNYSTYPFALNYFTPIPSFNTANFNNVNQTDSLNDFAFQPASIINDLCISITPVSNFRAGMNGYYEIHYENVGTTTLTPTVIFFPDGLLSFVSSNPAATSVTTDSVIWNGAPFTPFQSASIFVTVNVNASTPIGTLINSNVRIEPIVGDANTVCNYNSWEVFTTGSADPNDILVNRDTIFTTELISPPFLEYLIRFQNTGNDTAFNIKIMNTISQSLDISTIEFMESSHAVQLSYISINRDMKFKFDNVLLPDSNVNEPGSHGFVRYRIKPLSTLIAGSVINNNAAIYFDFNLPVMTDTAITKIVLPTGMDQITNSDLQFTVLPNPASQSVTINLIQPQPANCKLFVFDLFGKEIYLSEIHNSQSETTIDLSGLSKGIYFIQLGERAIYRAKLVKL